MQEGAMNGQEAVLDWKVNSDKPQVVIFSSVYTGIHKDSVNPKFIGEYRAYF